VAIRREKKRKRRGKKLWLRFKKSNPVKDFKVLVCLARFKEKKKER